MRRLPETLCDLSPETTARVLEAVEEWDKRGAVLSDVAQLGAWSAVGELGVGVRFW
jgi:predicted amino acid dehydrogenase